MTTLTGRWVWGPASGKNGTTPFAAGYSTYALDDSNDAVKVRFPVPKDGTLSKIGVYIHAVTGNPPAYQVIFRDLAGSAYGGCAAQAIDFTTTGFQWTTLSTPAAAQAGDIVEAFLEPTGTAPDGSNCVTVRNGMMSETSILIPRSLLYSTSWSLQGLFDVGVLYSDDSVAMPGLTSGAANVDNATTPDEVGGLFTVPFACKCAGARFAVDPAGTSSDFVVALMNAANDVLATKTLDATYEAGIGLYDFTWDEVSLTVATNYRLTVAPNSVNNVTVTVAYGESTASKQWFTEGTRWQLTSRADAGAWTEMDTAIPMFALILSEITLPDAGGGGASAGGMLIG